MDYLSSTINNIFPKSYFTWIKKIKKVTSLLDNWKFVGGVVRDSLLGIKTKDVDIVTTMTPEQTLAKVKHLNTSGVGARFGTISVFWHGWKIEITTCRVDVENLGRKAIVAWTSSFKEDSKRRDFTINSIMMDEKFINDFHNGIYDLKRGIVRFIGDAQSRIQEDYLRILRWIRFSTRFNKFQPYSRVVKKNIEGLKKVSMERVISEILLITKLPSWKIGLQWINKLSISKILWNKDLFLNFKSKNHNEISSFIFLNLNWQKLPIPREVKKTLSVIIEKYKDPMLQIAYLWYKKQDINIYLKIMKIKGTPLKVNRKLFKHKDFIEKSWTGEERGLSDIIERYLIIKKKSVNNRTIESLFEYVRNNQVLKSN